MPPGEVVTLFAFNHLPGFHPGGYRIDHASVLNHLLLYGSRSSRVQVPCLIRHSFDGLKTSHTLIHGCFHHRVVPASLTHPQQPVGLAGSTTNRQRDAGSNRLSFIPVTASFNRLFHVPGKISQDALAMSHHLASQPDQPDHLPLP